MRLLEFMMESQHDMAFEYFQDVPRRTASDNVLGAKAFNIAGDLKNDGINVNLHPWFTNFLTKNLLLIQKQE